MFFLSECNWIEWWYETGWSCSFVFVKVEVFVLGQELIYKVRYMELFTTALSKYGYCSIICIQFRPMYTETNRTQHEIMYNWIYVCSHEFVEWCSLIVNSKPSRFWQNGISDLILKNRGTQVGFLGFQKCTKLVSLFESFWFF